MTMIDVIKWAFLFLALNLLVFSIYLRDKQAARQGKRRISKRRCPDRSQCLETAPETAGSDAA
ncbi:hypothetical protein BA011_05980 [Rhizobium leguminosarum]|uniref:Uncharacterized protein n=1 Tax=Rhizobium leguminosarum TaxID=384 RepID=A0A1B1C6A6_RHILE|nr:hypothetical protein BA011_05980 [Rhizobium leguminosarum]